MAADLSSPETANLTKKSSAADAEPVEGFSFSSVELRKLPHVTDYLPMSNLSSRPNPLERNEFFHPMEGFYISPSDVILRQIVYDLSGTFSDNSSHLAYHRFGHLISSLPPSLYLSLEHLESNLLPPPLTETVDCLTLIS